MSGLHSKLGFKVEELRPKAGGKPVKGSSIPLILPNDLKYNASTGKAEKIQGAQRTSLQVVPEALDLLMGIEEPVSVFSICGPCRSGKSYILSRLLGTADAFELGHLMDPQTFGIWMGTKVLRGKGFTIVLLDTEGIDAVAASAGQDASILVMTILLSSHLIYNSLNVPYKADLEKMQCFIKLAKGITVKKGEGTDVAAFREFFPDFLWLLRDVSLKMVDGNGKEMDPTEYLKTKVLRCQGENGSSSDKVGRAILGFFSSVECATLERPSGDSDIMNSIAQHTGRLNSRFNAGVENLIKRLLLKSRAKRGYIEGSTVNGVALSIMAEQYVEAVNDPNSIPALDNTWKNTVEVMRNKAIEEAVVDYTQHMQSQVAKAKWSGNVPLEEDREIGRKQPSQPTLIDLHNQQSKEVIDMLLKKVGHIGTSDENRTVVDQLQKRLIQKEERTVDHVSAHGTVRKRKEFVVTGGELFQYIQQNREHSRIFCRNRSERLLDPIRKHVESPPTDYDSTQLMMELNLSRQQYEEQARGPEKWVVLQEMAKNCEQLKADFRRIEEYHKKLRQEQQKAEEAKLRARERDTQLQQLRQQVQEMPLAQQEIVQQLEEQHRKLVEEFAHGAADQRAQEEQKYQELLEALMKEGIKMAVEEFVFSLNLELQRKRQELELEITRRRLESLSEAMDNLPSPPPEDNGCTIS